MANNTPSLAEPRRQLTLLDSTCIIVGIIIGSGVYEMTPLIARNVGSAAGLIGACLVGGLISLVGAMCYVELTTAYPREGGDYVFLSKAFGRRAGFLFAWAEFWILRPGNIGMLAFVFARYAHQLYPLNLHPQHARYDFLIYAGSAVLLLSIINLLGVQSGKWTQNLLTLFKVVGLLAIFVIGFFFVPAAVAGAPLAEQTSSPNFSTAVILTLFIYGGWNEMSYVAAEVKNPQRNISRALIFGTLTVTVVYCLVYLAFIRVLGFDGIRQSDALAADMFQSHFGSRAARMMSMLVCISCLGAINGMIFTGCRISYALGKEHRLYAWLGSWSKRQDAPIRALLLQAVVAIALIVGFGWYANGFERLFYFTAPLFWFFIFMVGISLFVLRHKEPNVPRPHRIALYPWLPILFCLTCAILFKSSLDYAISNKSYEAAWTIGFLAVGIGLSFYDPPMEEARVER